LVNNKPQGENKGKENTTKKQSSKHEPSHEGCITTAMPGTIIDIKVKVGDSVDEGDSVVVIEAMKMENEIQAPKSGIVMAVHVAKGDNVSPNETLLEIQST
jgi:pyruvate carboxylase subunit B